MARRPLSPCSYARSRGLAQGYLHRTWRARRTLLSPLVICLLLLAIFSTAPVSAAPIANLTPIAGLTWTNVVANSVERSHGNTQTAPMAPLLDPQAYRLPSVFWLLDPRFHVDLLMEMSDYQEENALYLCNSVVCDPLFVGSSLTGDGATRTPSLTPWYYFALATVGNTWISNGPGNADGLDHFVAFQVLNPGTVSIARTRRTLADSSLSVDLRPGDLIIGIEDLPGPMGPNGLMSDRDYNDMIFIMRQPPTVPEPSLMLLVGTGLAGLAAMRRRRMR